MLSLECVHSNIMPLKSCYPVSEIEVGSRVDQSTAKKTFHVRTYDEYWIVNFHFLKMTDFYLGVYITRQLYSISYIMRLYLLSVFVACA